MNFLGSKFEHIVESNYCYVPDATFLEFALWTTTEGPNSFEEHLSLSLGITALLVILFHVHLSAHGFLIFYQEQTLY